MPKDPNLKFKNYEKRVDLADVVYADSEAILQPCIDEPGKLQKHVPCCVGSYFVSKVEGNRYTEFSGPQCMEEFLDHLEDLAKHIHERNATATRVPAERTPA